jgi:hypothetical protein
MTRRQKFANFFEGPPNSELLKRYSFQSKKKVRIVQMPVGFFCKTFFDVEREEILNITFLGEEFEK